MLPRWEPFREIISLRDAIDRLFDDSVSRPRDWLTSWQTGVGTFPMDIFDEDDTLVVRASAPGFKPGDIKVEVRDTVLTLSGEMRRDDTRKADKYHLREHHYGRYERSVILPYTVDVEQATALFEDGILLLTLPRGHTVRAKQIAVKTRDSEPA